LTGSRFFAALNYRTVRDGQLAFAGNSIERRLTLKKRFLVAMLIALSRFAGSWTAAAQTWRNPSFSGCSSTNALDAAPIASTQGFGWTDAGGKLSGVVAEPESAPPAAPTPVAFGGGADHYEIAPTANWRQIPFSRLGFGADVSPLGFGVKSAIVLNHYFDARLMTNFFRYDSGRFETDSFNLDVNLHLASTAASLDWYPLGSVFRISPGILLYNGNRISATAKIVSGASFTPEGQIYYSAYPNATTGATPLSGTGVLGLNRHRPAATLTGGFGKYIPRSGRHWSFPSEFGVAFTGAPTATVHMSGWACLDEAQTQCGNLGDAKSAVGMEFNKDIHARIATWQNDLNKVGIYPLFSYSVMFSFNIR
jgi:hypothetical protein